MASPIFVIIILVFLVAIISAIFFNKKAVFKRRFKKAALKRISEVRTDELVRVTGKVEFNGPPLRAPLSGRRCAYYHVLVEVKKSSGKSSYWKKLIDEEESCSFLIRDGNAYAYIDCTTVKTLLVQDRHYSSGTFKDATPVLDAYLNKHGHKSTSFLGFNRSIRYKEAILEEGEEVAALGKCCWKQGEELKLNMISGKVLRVFADGEHEVYMTDHPDIVSVRS